MASADAPEYSSTAMDRVFGGARIIAVTGPVAGLDAEQVRSTLQRAADSSSTPRLALDPTDRKAWGYRSHIAGHNVIEWPDADTSDLGTLLTDVRNRPGEKSPLEVVVAGDYVALDFTHCLGDGQIGIMMLAALSADPDGTAAPALAVGLPSDATWTALRRHYGSSPSKVKDFWKLRSHHKRREPDDHLPTRRIENWEASKMSRSAHMSADTVAQLRDWAKDNAPGATGAAVSVALWRAAVASENVTVDPHVMILFNSRRYLSEEYLAAHGNFAVGIPLHLPQSTSATDIADVMKQVIDSGWPIAILGMSEVKDKLMSIKGRRRAHAAADSSVVEVPDRLRLAVSDLGKLRMFGDVEWTTDGRPPQVAASLEPDGPDGVTMLISDLAGGRTYTASFCSEMVDPTVIDSALARVCSDPVSVLKDVRV